MPEACGYISCPCCRSDSHSRTCFEETDCCTGENFISCKICGYYKLVTLANKESELDADKDLLEHGKPFRKWRSNQYFIYETIAICPDCNNEIDVDVCHCGIEKNSHNPYIVGHEFVPMGCVCFYDRTDETKDKI